jgi:hypothetical protein
MKITSNQIHIGVTVILVILVIILLVTILKPKNNGNDAELKNYQDLYIQ